MQELLEVLRALIVDDQLSKALLMLKQGLIMIDAHMQISPWIARSQYAPGVLRILDGTADGEEEGAGNGERREGQAAIDANVNFLDSLTRSGFPRAARPNPPKFFRFSAGG
ncbi:hypothetical protein GALMADRAFT_229438 [Galerina marginata CBS 339.88]|uniref:Uncharacterized protein n=1 Tax=Galerina marginata (strain CBS 339.88) TaxID=685588 RepID=A0A067SXJ2_GALM3|nr:hypothetical protein GALMADRAFT_229438 [Galerina marginata CBS 339.88]